MAKQEVDVQENVEKEEDETIEVKKRKLGGMKTMPFILGKVDSLTFIFLKIWREGENLGDFMHACRRPLNLKDFIF